MDPTIIVEDTERTPFCPQMDRRTDRWTDKIKTSIPPFQLRWSGGYKHGDIWQRTKEIWASNLSHYENLVFIVWEVGGSYFLSSLPLNSHILRPIPPSHMHLTTLLTKKHVAFHKKKSSNDIFWGWKQSVKLWFEIKSWSTSDTG